jgi:RHS repeat-associated protein
VDRQAFRNLGSRSISASWSAIAGNRVAWVLIAAVVAVSAAYFHGGEPASAVTCPPGISYGDVIQCSIATSGETDSYPISVIAGERANIKLTRTSGNLSPSVSLLRTNGTTLCSASGSVSAEIFECLIDATGTYTVRAKGSGTTTGDYALYAQRISNPVGGIAIGYGQTIGRSLVQGARDSFTFSGGAGERVFVRMATTGGLGDPLDPQIRIYNPDGSLLCSVGFADYGDSIGNDCLLSTSGTHTITVGDLTGGDAGGYYLHVQRTTNPVGATSIGYGQAAVGFLQAGEMKAYKFSGSAGDQVFVKMIVAQAASDPWIRLYKSDGSLDCCPDGGAPPSCSEASYGDYVDYICPASGQMVLLVGDYSGPTPGNYSVFVQKTNPPVGAVGIANGAAISGAFPDGSMAAYTFAGSSGQTAHFTLAVSPTSSTSDLIIFNPSGSQACRSANYSGNTSISCVLSTGGTFALFAGTWKTIYPTMPPVYNPTHPVSSACAGDGWWHHCHPVPMSKDPVNLASGDFVHTHTDITVATLGVGLSFTRSYHSGSGIDGPLGFGWTHSFNMFVQPSGSDVYVYHPDGHASLFIFSGGGYAAQPGVLDTLTYTSVDDTFTLTTPQQIRYVFGALSGSSRKLQTILDRNGNAVNLTYDGNGRLDRVSDSAPSPETRYLQFGYSGTSSRISTITDSLASPDTRTVQFTYDSSGNLWKVKDVKSDPTNGPFTVYTYDANHRMLTLTDTNGHLALRLNVYDSSGRVVEQHDAFDKITCFHYGVSPTYSTNCPSGSTPAANQTIVFDPLRNKTTYTFDASFRLSSVTDASTPTPGVVQFTYDSNNDIACLTDQAGNRTAYVYQTGNLVQMIDPNNTDGNCQLKSGGVSWRSSYTTLNDVSTSTDPLGNVTTFLYDSVGNLTRLIHNKFQITATDTDGDSYPDSTPSGGRAAESYLGTNSSSNCAATSTANDEPVDPWPPDFNDDGIVNGSDNLAFSPVFGKHSGDPGWSPRFDLNQDGVINGSDLLQLSPFFGLRCPSPLTLTCFEYDSHGLVTKVVESSTLTRAASPTSPCVGNSTSLAYNTVTGDLAGITYPRSGSPHQVVYTADAIGRLHSVTNELGHITTYTYDAFNMPLTRTDNAGIASWTYDAKGNLKTAADANRATIGNPESCLPLGTGNGIDDDPADDGSPTVPVIDDGCASTINNYDVGDRLTSVIDALAHTTSYSYDANSNLATVMNPSHQPVGGAESGANCANDADNDGDGVADDGCPSTSYTYDPINRRTVEKDSLGRQTLYAYVTFNTVQVTDPRSVVVTYGLDALNRVHTIASAGQPTIQYDYDTVGNRIQMSDGTGTTTYAYADRLNRLTSVTYPGSQTVGYQYDALGNESIVTYPGSAGTVAYNYNADHTLQAVTPSWTPATTYSYDDAGQVVATQLPNGVNSTFGYDNADRLTSVSNMQPGPTTMSSFTYTLDKIGNRTSMTGTGGPQTYRYDAVYQLVKATYPGSVTDNYTYDADGNRKTKNATTYSYDVAGQMTSAGGVTYTYDPAGNLATRGADTFTFDYRNRMTNAAVGGLASSSTYNGDGLRASHSANGQMANYIWDINRSTSEVLTDGTNKYVYGLDLVSATDGSGNVTYFTTDGLGSTTDLTDSNGAKTDGYNYDVFGAQSHSLGASSNQRLFAGEQSDAGVADSGLQYLRARYYDPTAGRFISRDPLRIGNRYSYVGSNPTTLSDPQGLWPSCPHQFCNPCNWFDCPDPCDLMGICPIDLFNHAKDWIYSQVTDHYNWASLAQLTFGAVAGIACPLSETGIGAVVCAEAIIGYLAASEVKLEIICEQIKAGKYSASEGWAKWVVGWLPLPFGIDSLLAKYGLQQVIGHVIHKDPADNCIGDALAGEGHSS